jgi:hypothetical protein
MSLRRGVERPDAGGGRVEQAIWLVYGLLVAVCWVAGIRLVRIAIRTHEVQEWSLGVVLLCTGGVGYPLLFLRSLLELPARQGSLSFAVGLAFLSAGSMALYVFNWRLFRPRSVVAALLASAGPFVIAWSFLAELLTIGFAWDRDVFWIALGGGARCLPFAWGGAEALARAFRLRREGAEAPAVRRFVLYGSALALIAVLYAAGLLSAAAGDGASHPRSIVALVALAGIPAAMALWIAFRPSRAPGHA